MNFLTRCGRAVLLMGLAAQVPLYGCAISGQSTKTESIATPVPMPFSFAASDAKRVFLATNLNAWARNVQGRPTDDAAVMTRRSDGVWVSEVRGADVVRYKFITEDAQGRFTWHADPANSQRDHEGNSVRLAGDGVHATPPGAPIAVRVSSSNGQITAILKAADGSFRDAVVLPAFFVDGVQQSPRLTSEAVPRAGTTLAVESVSPNAVAITWQSDGREPRELEAHVRDNSRYYGGGERFHALNQKGYVLPMGSLDRPEDKGVCSYKPVPFIISSRGYGLWLDSTTPSEFDLNATSRDEIKIRDRNTSMRLVLITGANTGEILAEFTRLTGRPSVPPAWAFAPWKSRDVHRNRDELLADVELSRKHDLPASVVVLDSPWETGYNNFILNERQFPDPDTMFARVRSLGFVPCFWLTPFINDSNVLDMAGIDAGASSNFKEAVDNGFLVKRADGSPMIVPWWKGTGGLVDFTNPAAKAWWLEQLAPTLRWGIAAIKCDDGESNFVQDAHFFDGSTAAAMKGRYASLYLQAAHDFLERHRPGDHTLISRCGFTGTGRWPFGWAGDNHADFSFENGLPGVIVAAQNAALSGQPFWGSDIAGYMGDATPELFIRWTQFAAFTPLMMVHMQSNKGPWDYSEQALDIYRRFARLHTALYPYFDNAAREAANAGVPIIRPMVLAFPDDPAAAKEQFQYMLGPDLLVAPMFQSGTSRSVYLPRGTWTDYWSGRRISGPRQIEIHAPLEQMPLFVRDGAVIPMLPDDVDTLLPRTPELDPSVVALDDRRVIEVWPGAGGTVRTADAIAATVSKHGQRMRLALRSEQRRDIEIRLRHAGEVHDTRYGDATVETQRIGSDTIIRSRTIEEPLVLEWTPR